MAISWEFTGGQKGSWPVSWISWCPMVAVLADHFFLLPNQGLQQLRRRGLVGEFVSIYEDEGSCAEILPTLR